MDVRVKMYALRYLGERVQQLAHELQGLGYELTSIDSRMNAPTGAYSPIKAVEFHQKAGNAARLQSQIDHTLREVKELMFAAESATPKREDS